MTDFIFILWVIDSLNSIDKATGVIIFTSITFAIVTVGVYLATCDLDSCSGSEKEKRDNTLKGILKCCAYLVVVSTLVSFVIPQKSTMENMLVIYAADTALELESTQKALGNMGDLAMKGSLALNKMLDDYLSAPTGE